MGMGVAQGHRMLGASERARVKGDGDGSGLCWVGTRIFREQEGTMLVRVRVRLELRLWFGLGKLV